jgi:LysR family carnitine catabolism transcriptional activator
MEFRQLAAVVAVADRGSFTAAAEEIGHSQPAVSQAVRAVERELGVRLFERLSSGVTLTSAGAAFVGPARQALHDREVALEAVRSVSGLEAGHLDIACIPSLAADVAAPVIGKFRRRHLGVTVRLREPDEGATVEDLVRAGRSEIGFCALPATGRGLVGHALEEQELFAVLSPGHASSMARRGAVPLERLAELPLITAPVGTSTYEQLAVALAAIGEVLTPAIETDHRDTIVPLVRAGAGAAVLPRAVAEATASRWARVLPLRPAISRTVGLIHREGVLSPAGEALTGLAVGDRGSRSS